MSRTIFASILLLAGTLPANSALAATIEVHQGQSIQEVHQGQSIQTALNKARPGDTVAVHRGTYHESVTFRGSGVKLKSVDGIGAAHIVSGGTPLFVHGGSNKEVSGFRLSAGKGGNGIQLGGTVSDFASGYTIKSNIIQTAGEDGIKAHQLDNSIIAENQIINAGTSNNSNKDGGIDFVAVRGTDLIANAVNQTSGDTCLMMKGGSTGNKISGNVLGGCKNAIHVGGLTDSQFQAPGSGGWQAYGNEITGNRFASSSCALYMAEGSRQHKDNTISGNEMEQPNGCSTEGGGGKLDGTPVTYDGDYGDEGSGDYSYDGGNGGTLDGYVQQIASQAGNKDICTAGQMASAAATAGGAAISITGRATAPLQIAQQIMLIFQGRCAAEQLNAQTTMLQGMSINTLPQVVAAMTQVMNALGKQQTTTYDLAQAEKNWQRHFRDTTGLESLPFELMTPEISKYYVSMRTRSADSMQEAARIRANAVQAMKANQRATQQAVDAGQNAEGIRGVIQAGNQILGTAVIQLQETTSTMIAYQEAQSRIQEEDRMGVVLARILHEANLASMGGKGLGRTETAGEIMGITGPIKVPQPVPAYPTPSEVTGGKLF